MLFHMKQVLIELDDRTARELERVAPTRKRMRAEFIRLAIRRALDLALDRATADAYRAAPGGGGAIEPADLSGWDPDNALAEPAAPRRRARSSSAA
jgi:predicted transcriptional regulator